MSMKSTRVVRSLSVGVVVAVAFTLSGCTLLNSVAERSENDAVVPSSTLQATSPPPAQSPSTVESWPTDQTDADDSKADPSEWRLSLEGFGPLRLGMTAAEGAATGGFVRIAYCDVGALAWTGKTDANGEPLVIANLDVDGRIWSISIHREPLPLDSGIRFGSTYDELVEAYGDALIASSLNNPANTSSGIFAVNGNGAHLHFVIYRGILDNANGISLQVGEVTPETVPDARSCEASWRQ